MFWNACHGCLHSNLRLQQSDQPVFADQEVVKSYYHLDREKEADSRAADAQQSKRSASASRPRGSGNVPVPSSAEGAALLLAGRVDTDDNVARGVVHPRQRARAALQASRDDSQPATRRPQATAAGAPPAGGSGGGNPGIRRPVAWRPSREEWLKKDAAD